MSVRGASREVHMSEETMQICSAQLTVAIARLCTSCSKSARLIGVCHCRQQQQQQQGQVKPRGDYGFSHCQGYREGFLGDARVGGGACAPAVFS